MLAILLSLLFLALTPTTVLPALSEAAGIQSLPCSDRPFVRAGFEEADGRYGLVYVGPVTLVKGMPVPSYPHVWIRFEGAEPVSVLLVSSEKTREVIDLSTLERRYPAICDLDKTLT